MLFDYRYIPHQGTLIVLTGQWCKRYQFKITGNKCALDHSYVGLVVFLFCTQAYRQWKLYFRAINSLLHSLHKWHSAVVLYCVVCFVLLCLDRIRAFSMHLYICLLYFCLFFRYDNCMVFRRQATQNHRALHIFTIRHTVLCWANQSGSNWFVCFTPCLTAQLPIGTHRRGTSYVGQNNSTLWYWLTSQFQWLPKQPFPGKICLA